MTRLIASALTLLCLRGLLAAQTPERLYNGIELTPPWPPRRDAVPYAPMDVPYLVAPPAVIPIDVGRQLFVDDFLIAETNLHRVHHQAEYHPASPLIVPDKPWEKNDQPASTMLYSDGVWYDSRDRLFKAWYMAAYWGGLAYATSKDGVHWEKPLLDVKPGTNLVLDQPRGTTTVWLDHEEQDPARRFKLYRQYAGKPPEFDLFTSPDGIHWKFAARDGGKSKDRSTIFRNPFRKVWVFSIKDDMAHGRMRRYWEHPDLIAGFNWGEKKNSIPWVSADPLDAQREDLRSPAQLYNLDAVAYESIMLGLFTIWRGQPEDRPKPNELIAGYSRDGFHWSRPNRRALIPVSERKGDWNWGNVQSAGGCLLVVKDKLYFYVSGRAGEPNSRESGICVTGLATLRRDGFASMRADETTGTLTTRPVQFSGAHLFVNAAAARGELQVEVLEENGRVIQPFSRANSIPITADETLISARWRGAPDLSALAGKPVRFRFYLTRGELFSFWVSASPRGASNGYLGAGGPGYPGVVDTVGDAALKN